MFFANFEFYVKRQILITIGLNMGVVVMGYQVFWTAPILPKLENMDETPLNHVVSPTESSRIASFIYFGCIGASLAGWISNYIGRRACLILGGILNIISAIFLTFSNTIGMIYAGRILTGCSTCFLYLTSVIYLGEIASPDIRGMLFSTTGISQAFGSLLLYSVGPFVSYQGVGYLAIGVSALCTLVNCFLPESPLYYLMKGDEEKAKQSLRALGRDKDINAELKSMIDLAKETKDNVYIWKELVTEKRNRNALLVIVPLFMSQQSSGVLAVGFFATNIFKSAGSSFPPHIATIIVGATSLFSATVSPMFIYKYGRRILMMISTAGCCVFMTILGVYFYLDKIGNPSVSWLGWLPLVCLVFALVFYAVGLGVIPSTIAGEMYTPNVRGLGSSIGLAAGFLSGFITTTLFGYLVAYVGIYATFWMFAAIDLAAFIFVILFVPETKGKTLNEIGIMMDT